MRIVIDARMLYWTGVGRYTKALLDNLAALDHETEYVVLTRPADRALWEPAAPNFTRVEVGINPYSVGEQLQLPGIITRLKPDLVHFTAGNAPVAYRGRYVVNVHDLTLLDYDTSRGTGIRRAVRRLKRIPFRWILGQVVRRAAIVLTPSQYIKDEVVRRSGVSPDRVRVTWLAADPKLAKPTAIERFGLGDEFILNVGNAYPYKTGLILEALALLAPQFPHLKLAMTARPDYFRDQLAARAQALGLADRLVFTGFVTDGELVGLYQAASLYLYPSLSEGFGLQLLEAMQQGLPVVASRASCLPEIGGGAAAYFDPTQADDIASTVASLLRDKHKRNAMIAAGHRRAAEFSWRQTAQATLESYLSLF